MQRYQEALKHWSSGKAKTHTQVKLKDRKQTHTYNNFKSTYWFKESVITVLSEDQALKILGEQVIAIQE